MAIMIMMMMMMMMIMIMIMIEALRLGEAITIKFVVLKMMDNLFAL